MINGIDAFQNPYDDFDIEKVKNDFTYNMEQSIFDDGSSTIAYYKAENGLFYLCQEFDTDADGVIDICSRAVFEGESLDNDPIVLMDEQIINNSKLDGSKVYALNVYKYSDEGYCTNTYTTVKKDENRDGEFDEISKIEYRNEYYLDEYTNSFSKDIDYDGVFDVSRTVEYDDEGKIIRTSGNIYNEHYQGETYTVNWDDKTGAMYDSNNKHIAQIDLSKVLGDVSEADKDNLVNELKQLPAEELIDVSNEAIFNTCITKDGRSHYSPSSDKIFLDSRHIDKSTITHELGHAVDFRFDPNSSKNVSQAVLSEKFQESYNAEMKKYLNDGNKRWAEKYDKDAGMAVVVEEVPGAYCTKNERDFFAECYELMMTGDSSSKDCIEKYFPNTFEIVKDIVSDTRELNINSDNSNNEEKDDNQETDQKTDSSQNIFQVILNKLGKVGKAIKDLLDSFYKALFNK